MTKLVYTTSRRGAVVIAPRSAPIRPGGSAVAMGVDPGPDTVQLDPYLYPPPNSTPFNLAANQAIVGVNQITTPAGLVLPIPQNCYGVINSVDLLLDSILITSNVLWTLRLNKIPIPGFAPITILGRNGAASVAKSWGPQLRLVVPLGAEISVQIQNVDGAPYTAGTQLQGWFWPQTRR